ncbi:ribbon-helix-helix domain-containing protein [Kordiimonas aestuarii]|uniref:ribbon-helix-helix domain-containing protein n=1 Tax=Kordiimonas aestuarii TaxID=1005925 RepID=UPI0021D05AB4|nr:ribbon-helix-helix domain-containing protein [Kordiimonas aestuarii]
MGKDGKNAARQTTTLTKQQKAELERLAKLRGVKVAWLVRQAVSRYLEDVSGGALLPFEMEGDEDDKC